MTEYGFAVGVSKAELDADKESAEEKVRHLLKFNHQQFVDFLAAQGGDTNIDSYPVYMIAPPWEYFEADMIKTEDGEDAVPYAWYVNTDPDYTPAEHHELLKEGV